MPNGSAQIVMVMMMTLNKDVSEDICHCCKVGAEIAVVNFCVLEIRSAPASGIELVVVAAQSGRGAKP